MDIRDFHASVDILDWDPDAPELNLGLLVRAYHDPVWPGDSNGYIGGIIFNPPGHVGQARLYLFTGGAPDYGGPTFPIDSEASYRLSFRGAGDELYLRLENLTNGEALVAERQRTATLFSQGPVGLWKGGRTISTMTVDNVVVSGTRP